MSLPRRLSLSFLMWIVSSRITTTAMMARQRPLAFAKLSRLSRQSLAMSLSTSKTDEEFLPPWSQPRDSAKQKFRARQHVNPLARRYQMPTILTPEWPQDVLENVQLPLYLDIGCGRGGFLLEMAAQGRSQQRNYLGLEIRPSIFQYASDRVAKRGLTGRLTFVGCNANVDLDRILSLYPGPIDTVSIQFPDPHFKSQHAKRRVVTPSLVSTLAKHMPESGRVFIQSDIKEVFDDMRLRFRESGYFQDEVADMEQFLSENPMGIQTERERSVLSRGLPVYRTILRRTDAQVNKE